MNTETKSYEEQMIDELCGIQDILDIHTVCYFCNPTRGYALICQDSDGYHVIANNQGFVTSGGPWDRAFVLESFLEDVRFLGGES
jgi:hypothetical protein